MVIRLLVNVIKKLKIIVIILFILFNKYKPSVTLFQYNIVVHSSNSCIYEVV